MGSVLIGGVTMDLAAEILLTATQAVGCATAAVILLVICDAGNSPE